jgi:hypothetical protein
MKQNIVRIDPRAAKFNLANQKMKLRRLRTELAQMGPEVPE